MFINFLSQQTHKYLHKYVTTYAQPDIESNVHVVNIININTCNNFVFFDKFDVFILYKCTYIKLLKWIC